ncbi:MAG: class I SAM-dependent methyltransferase [Alishewanella sp.]|nr:class I SAM-dependent methyltransferase [Alishewanella sp.]MDP5187083.1 class I SAM-dependent methyltransferase [Alishewanella sp.]
MSAVLLITDLPAELSAELTQRFGLTLSDSATGWHLRWVEQQLVLRHTDMPKQGDIVVDFASAAATYRRQHGGAKSEGIAKACGLHKKRDLQIIDATAGLGRDALVLANVGAHVTLVERNPLVAALLYDGLQRAAAHASTAELASRMQLHFAPALQALTCLPTADVVYLDPMFPPREKSALVKKEMRAFHDVVGSDTDADALLEPALALAKYRVVVKRPGYAQVLAQREPQLVVKGKNNRFDVYIKQAIT